MALVIIDSEMKDVALGALPPDRRVPPGLAKHKDLTGAKKLQDREVRSVGLDGALKREPIKPRIDPANSLAKTSQPVA
jgi:hypothetical protein